MVFKQKTTKYFTHIWITFEILIKQIIGTNGQTAINKRLSDFSDIRHKSLMIVKYEDLQNIHNYKTKDRITQTPLKPRVNSGAL